MRGVEKIAADLKWKQKEDERRRKQQAERQSRTTSRYRSYNELAARNREQGEHAKALVELSGPAGYESPWIILREAGDDGMGAVGKVTRLGMEKKGKKQRYYRFSVGLCTKHNLNLLREGVAARPIGSEDDKYTVSTFDENVDGTRYKDQIDRRAAARVNADRFDPIGAYKRVRDVRKIESHIDQVGELLVEFEAAAEDPMLNPQLIPVPQTQANEQ